MSEPSGRFGTYVHFFLWALALAGFYLTSRYSLPLFQGIAGVFSVVIAGGVFAVAWNSRGFLENNYLLFLGIAYLFVGALDLLHTLAYGGMRVFPGFGADLPVQLGFAARGLESVSLCLAPLCLGRRLQPYAVFAGFFLAFAVIILIIFVWPIFPLRGGGRAGSDRAEANRRLFSPASSCWGPWPCCGAGGRSSTPRCSTCCWQPSPWPPARNWPVPFLPGRPARPVWWPNSSKFCHFS